MLNMVNRRCKLRSTPNSWYQSALGPRICETKTRKNNRNDFWNQRRREVVQQMDYLKLCNQEGICDRKSRNSKKMKKSRCYICFVRGHAYWNCPNKNKRIEFKKGKHEDVKKPEENNVPSKAELEIVTPSITWQVKGTEYGGWNDIWYVSNEFPRHMTPNIELFDKFKAGNEGTSASVQDGLNVQGIGEVIVQTEKRNFVMPGVYYVPNAGLNTLSLNQLIQQGFKVNFEYANCEVKRLFDESESDEEEGCIGEEDRIEMNKKRAVEAMMRYCDSLYFKENTIEESLNGDQGLKVPSRNEFESFIGFMEMVNEQEIIKGCKELVKNHFEKMVQWFYKEYMQCEERPIPAKINGIEVCLLDLYLTVKGMGGHTQVVKKNKWISVAYAMGFPKEYADGLEKCYGRHLSLLGAYYEVARNYSSGVDVPKAMECKGTSGIVAKELPREETRPEHIGTKARQVEVASKERMGKIEFDDGENLIIIFEDNNEEPMEEDAISKEMEMNVEQSTIDGDYIIVEE